MERSRVRRAFELFFLFCFFSSTAFIFVIQMTPTPDSAPMPWKIDTEENGAYGNRTHIRDANGLSLFCDEQYYPWVTVSEFPRIVEAVNSYAEREAKMRRYEKALKKIANSMGKAWGDSIPCQECGGTEIAKAALSDPSGENKEK